MKQNCYLERGEPQYSHGVIHKTTWTRLSGWVVGQMSTIVHYKQVGGSSNVHVDKMPERFRTKLPKIVGKRKFFCQKHITKIKSRPQHHRIQAIHLFLKLDYKSQKVNFKVHIDFRKWVHECPRGHWQVVIDMSMDVHLRWVGGQKWSKSCPHGL